MLHGKVFLLRSSQIDLERGEYSLLIEESFPSDLMQKCKETKNLSTKAPGQGEVIENSLSGPPSSCQPSVSFEDLSLSAV